MILSDSEIIKAIKLGDIVIEPYNPEQLNPNSYDVTLDNIIATYSNDVLDSRKHNRVTRRTIPPEGMTLYPNTLYLSTTVERVNSRLYRPSINGKSSIGRLGISIHITAGYGDVGFSGNSWTLEITVVHPVIIYPNMRIGQIEFCEVRGKVITPYNKKKGSKYNENNKAVESLNWMNYEEQDNMDS